jgi:hypothetical protein
MQDVFHDPDFQERLEIMSRMGPQNAGKASATPNAINQNSQVPTTRPIPTPQTLFNQDAQQLAGIGQQNMTIGGGLI